MAGRPTLDGSHLDREVPSFIEPRPPANYNPWRQLKPVHLQFDEESVSEHDINEHYKVYLRLKPSKDISSHYEIKSNACLITNGLDYSKKTKTKISKMYEFSQIFGLSSTQTEIFDEIIKDNLDSLPNQNFTLLTYGASGSGKTFTLMGSVEKPGLIPRSLEYLFRIIGTSQIAEFMPKDGSIVQLNPEQQALEFQMAGSLRRPCKKAKKYKRMSIRLSTEYSNTGCFVKKDKYFIWVSYIEIYNENIYDLLDPSGLKQSKKLKIYEDPKYGAFVKGLKQIFVKSGTEAYDVMLYGQSNLTFAATGIHNNSSRSHSIFTITLVTVKEDGSHYTSHMRLCDLAGAERAAKTDNTGDRMQESKHINNSLHVLELCLRSLRSKQEKSQEFVPFRQSKLTRILSRALSGASHEKVGIVININPDPDFVMETRHVLELASVATSIRVNTSEETTSSQDTIMSEDLSEEVTRLRSERDRLFFELEITRSTVQRLKCDSEQQREMLYSKMVEHTQEAAEQARQRQYKQDQIEIEKLRKENQKLMEKFRKLKRQFQMRKDHNNDPDASIELKKSILIDLTSSDDSDSEDDSGSEQRNDSSSSQNASRNSHITLESITEADREDSFENS